MLINRCSENKCGLIKEEVSQRFDCSRSSEDLFGSTPYTCIWEVAIHNVFTVSLFSQTCFVTLIPGICTMHKPCNQGIQGRCVRSKKQQISAGMLIYTLSEKLYYFNKRGKNLNYTLFKFEALLELVTHTNWKGMQLRSPK